MKWRRAVRALEIVSISTLLACAGQKDPLFNASSEQKGDDPPGSGDHPPSSGDTPPGGEPQCSTTNENAGELDKTFGTNGITRIKFGADDDGGYFGLDVNGDRIVAGGWGAGGLGAIRMRLAKLGQDGALDATFGEGGLVSTGFGNSTQDVVLAVALGHQSSGQVVAMGWRGPFNNDSANIALTRYEQDGSLDPIFGQNGKALIDLGGEEEIKDGLVLPDDEMIVVGSRDAELLVARVATNGSLDTTFASPAGYVSLNLGATTVAQSVARAKNGDLLVAGWSKPSGPREGVVLRLSADGTFISTFGVDGKVVFHDAELDEWGLSIAEAPDGRIVVGAQVVSPDGAMPEVRRFLENGAPDPSFGKEGIARPPAGFGLMQSVDKMVLLPGGGALFAGNQSHGHPLLVRMTCDGALDTSFGVDGVLSVDFGADGSIGALLVESNANVLLGGGDVGGTPGPGTYGIIARMRL